MSCGPGWRVAGVLLVGALLASGGCARRAAPDGRPSAASGDVAGASGEELWQAACARAAQLADEREVEHMRRAGWSAEEMARRADVRAHDWKRTEVDCLAWMRKRGAARADPPARCLVAAADEDDLWACAALLLDGRMSDSFGGVELTVRRAPEAWSCPGAPTDLAAVGRAIAARTAGLRVEATLPGPDTLRLRVYPLDDDNDGRREIDDILRPGCLTIRAVADGSGDGVEVLPELSPTRVGEPLFVETAALLDGRDVSGALPEPTPDGGWRVSIELTATGTERFAEATAARVGGRLAIVLDGEVLAAPIVTEPLDSGRVQFPVGKRGAEDGGWDEAVHLALRIAAAAHAHPPLVEVDRHFVPRKSEREPR